MLYYDIPYLDVKHEGPLSGHLRQGKIFRQEGGNPQQALKNTNEMS